MSDSSGNSVSDQETGMRREDIEAIARDCRDRGDTRGLESANALLECLERQQATQPSSRLVKMEPGCGFPSLAGAAA